MIQYLYTNYMVINDYLKLDSTKAYQGYKNMLRLLSYQCGEAEAPRRWMLKCPIHLFYIKQIEAVFPDAKLIWTHRHPVSAVPSLCSLIKAFHSVYYEPECMDVNGKVFSSWKFTFCLKKKKKKLNLHWFCISSWKKHRGTNWRYFGQCISWHRKFFID